MELLNYLIKGDFYIDKNVLIRSICLEKMAN